MRIPGRIPAACVMALAWAAGPASPQPAPKDPARNVPSDLQAKIDAAIEKGTKALIAAAPKLKDKDPDHSELVLYTLHHARVPESDPAMQLLLDRVTKKELKNNYMAAMQAVALEAIDRVKYQPRIAQCAQHLIDNQCESGQWDYGEPTPIPQFTPSGTVRITLTGPSSGAAPAAPAAGKPAAGQTVVLPRIRLRQQQVQKRPGDNSNLQYALLGLRSCMMAGIEIPPEVLKRSEDWLTKDQKPDGGWDYGKDERHPSYGSMTEGAVGSLAICGFYQGRDPRRDPRVLKGAKWIADHLAFDGNPDCPGSHERWRFYHVYAVERAGIFLQAETFGAHRWYLEGAQYLVGSQREDGTWLAPHDLPIADTCFAILFLRRATAPLTKVYTQGG